MIHKSWLSLLFLFSSRFCIISFSIIFLFDWSAIYIVSYSIIILSFYYFLSIHLWIISISTHRCQSFRIYLFYYRLYFIYLSINYSIFIHHVNNIDIWVDDFIFISSDGWLLVISFLTTRILWCSLFLSRS